MNRTWQLVTAVVAGILVIGLGAAWLGGSGGVGRPSSSPAPTPTPSPYPTAGLAAPGTYSLHLPAIPGISFTVPAGWGFGGAGGPVKNDGTTRAVGLSPWIVGNIYADPCQWGDGLVAPPVGPSVDDLASALARQPLRNGTAPTAVTLDGYAGKYLELTTPTDLDPSTCSRVPGAGQSSPGFFVTWVGPALTDDYMGFAGPGSRDRVWILDVDGVRLVLAATIFPDATAADRAELQSIVDSIQVEPLTRTPPASPSASP